MLGSATKLRSPPRKLKVVLGIRYSDSMVLRRVFEFSGSM